MADLLPGQDVQVEGSDRRSRCPALARRDPDIGFCVTAVLRHPTALLCGAFLPWCRRAGPTPIHLRNGAPGTGWLRTMPRSMR